jgi:hypothetical protein
VRWQRQLELRSIAAAIGSIAAAIAGSPAVETIVCGAYP